MITNTFQNRKKSLGRARCVGRDASTQYSSKISFKIVCIIAVWVAMLSPSALRAEPKASDAQADGATGKVIGLKYSCVHVLKLEKTLKLYREILGFKMIGADVLRGGGVEGLLVMKLDANGCQVHLSLPAPEHLDTVGPIGNTNHNHFMLLVDHIVPICEQLKKEGYELENEEYARDKYTFFTGPNGEIIGLTEYK